MKLRVFLHQQFRNVAFFFLKTTQLFPGNAFFLLNDFFDGQGIGTQFRFGVVNALLLFDNFRFAGQQRRFARVHVFFVFNKTKRDGEAFQPFRFGVDGRPFLVMFALRIQFFHLRCDLFGQDTVDLFDFVLFLGHSFLRGIFSVFVHACSGGFFDQTKNFIGVHVQHFGNAPLHDEEMWVVDVQLHGVEQVLDLFLLGHVAID